jgi:hypothetical protein
MIPDYSHFCSENDLRLALGRRKSVQLYRAETRPDSWLGFVGGQLMSGILLGLFVLPLSIIPLAIAQIFIDRKLYSPMSTALWFGAGLALTTYWSFTRGGGWRSFRDRYRTSSVQTLTLDPLQQCVIAREEFPSAPALSRESRLTFKALRSQIHEFRPEPSDDTGAPDITVRLSPSSGASLKMQWADREVTRPMFRRELVDVARVREEAREFAQLLAAVGIASKSLVAQ